VSFSITEHPTGRSNFWNIIYGQTKFMHMTAIGQVLQKSSAAAGVERGCSSDDTNLKFQLK
jgi:hypothetical protein